jgi:hypothetical protein
VRKSGFVAKGRRPSNLVRSFNQIFLSNLRVFEISALSSGLHYHGKSEAEYKSKHNEWFSYLVEPSTRGNYLFLSKLFTKLVANSRTSIGHIAKPVSHMRNEVNEANQT